MFAQLRAATWLLIGWCVAGAAAILTAFAAAIVCPFGQEGCQLDPTVPARVVVPVVLVGVVLFAALWWWDRNRAPADRERAPADRDDPERLTDKRPRWRYLLPLSALAVIAMSHLVLLAPQQDRPLCQEVRLNAYMAYPYNCDSPLLMELAHAPGEVFEPGSFRQSRPGYVAVAAALTAVVGPVADAIGLDRLYGQTDDAYVPLVLFNLLLAYATLVLFAWLLFDLGAPAVVVVAVSAFMVVNDMTKAFTWSPHQQMFTLLVPVGTIFAVRWVLLARPSLRAIGVLGLLIGLAGLFYGSVLITLAAVSLALLGRGWRRWLGYSTVLGAGFAVPTLAWIGLCRAVAGSYYMAETREYHQFVWLPESAMHGARELYYRIRSYSLFTVREVIEAATPMILLFAVLVAIAILVRADLMPADPAARATLIGAALTVACGLAFCWGIGTWTYRLAFHLVPPLLLLSGWVATRIARRSPGWMTATTVVAPLVAIAWIGYEVFKPGPYG